MWPEARPLHPEPVVPQESPTLSSGSQSSTTSCVSGGGCRECAGWQPPESDPPDGPWQRTRERAAVFHGEGGRNVQSSWQPVNDQHTCMQRPLPARHRRQQGAVGPQPQAAAHPGPGCQRTRGARPRGSLWEHTCMSPTSSGVLCFPKAAPGHPVVPVNATEKLKDLPSVTQTLSFW